MKTITLYVIITAALAMFASAMTTTWEAGFEDGRIFGCEAFKESSITGQNRAFTGSALQRLASDKFSEFVKKGMPPFDREEFIQAFKLGYDAGRKGQLCGDQN
jgi:hypothetical protein